MTTYGININEIIIYVNNFNSMYILNGKSYGIAGEHHHTLFQMDTCLFIWYIHETVFIIITILTGLTEPIYKELDIISLPYDINPMDIAKTAFMIYSIQLNALLPEISIQFNN